MGSETTVTKYNEDDLPTFTPMPWYIQFDTFCTASHVSP